MTIAIGSDHAGFELKEKIKDFLKTLNLNTHDAGTHSAESMDYPDIAHPVAEEVEKHRCKLGILLCGSANGVAITANKHLGIRAAICWNNELADLARKHNDANVLCIPARFVSEDQAIQIVKTFLESSFEGGRHKKRVEKIPC